MALSSTCIEDGCGRDISHRRGPAVRCEECQSVRRRDQNKRSAAALKKRDPSYWARWQRQLRAAG